MILVLINFSHEIYQTFDDNLEVRAVFFNASKVVDVFRHKDLIFKLKQSDKSDKIFTDFLQKTTGRFKKASLPLG